jgi:hypothetical protein
MPTRTVKETASRRLVQKQNHKKADMAEHPEVFDHIGLLFNEPPGTAGLFFI